MMHSDRTTGGSLNSTWPSLLVSAFEQAEMRSTRTVEDLIVQFHRLDEWQEKADCLSSIHAKVRQGERVGVRALESLLPALSADRLNRFVADLIKGNRAHFGDLYLYSIALPSGDMRQLLHRALLRHYINDPELRSTVPGEFLDRFGLRAALRVLALPSGVRQGFGLCTDFYLTSRIALDGLGRISHLPLPERFPKFEPISAGAVALSPEIQASSLGYERRVDFGRSARYQLRGTAGHPTRYWYAFKGVQSDASAAEPLSNDTLARLGYEARVMRYLVRWKHYFGLESELPLPALGVRDRTRVWRFKDGSFLHYSASESYFCYLDRASSFDEMRTGLLRCMRDLGRLARFGIFHTELAPIFHSISQRRSYLWNIGGLAPGAGRLLDWSNAFQFANMRHSGLADFEHLIRVKCPPAMCEVTHDGIDQRSHSLQTYLGNGVFAAFHIAALWCKRHDSFDYDKIHALLRDILGESFRGYTGTAWDGIGADVDLCECAEEFMRCFSGGPASKEYCCGDGTREDLGRGAYPVQSFIRATTAFTIKAIRTFVQRRRDLLLDVQRFARPADENFGDRISGECRSRETRESVVEELKALAAVRCCVSCGVSEEVLIGALLSIRGKGIGFNDRMQVVAVRLDEFRRVLRKQMGPSRVDALFQQIFINDERGLSRPLSSLVGPDIASSIWLQ